MLGRFSSRPEAQVKDGVKSFVIQTPQGGWRGQREKKREVRLSEHVGTILIKTRGSGERWCKVIRHPEERERESGRKREGREEISGGVSEPTREDNVFVILCTCINISILDHLKDHISHARLLTVDEMRIEERLRGLKSLSANLDDLTIRESVILHETGRLLS
jgi:hypothetical protein